MATEYVRLPGQLCAARNREISLTMARGQAYALTARRLDPGQVLCHGLSQRRWCLTKAALVDHGAAVVQLSTYQIATVTTQFLQAIMDALHVGTPWHYGALGASGSATASRVQDASREQGTRSRVRPERFPHLLREKRAPCHARTELPPEVAGVQGE